MKQLHDFWPDWSMDKIYTLTLLKYAPRSSDHFSIGYVERSSAWNIKAISRHSCSRVRKSPSMKHNILAVFPFKYSLKLYLIFGNSASNTSLLLFAWALLIPKQIWPAANCLILILRFKLYISGAGPAFAEKAISGKICQALRDT